jgi:hypothetical protein
VGDEDIAAALRAALLANAAVAELALVLAQMELLITQLEARVKVLEGR